MRQIQFVDDDSIPPNEAYIFNASDILSRETQIPLRNIANSSLSTKEKIAKILKIKQQWLNVIKDADEHNLLKSYFTVDGGIMLEESDLNDILWCMYMGDENGVSKMNQDIENPYIQSLYEDFCYIRGNSLNFRNHNYYFLFGSLDINSEEIELNSSVNDYSILGVDIEQFEKDLYTQYNRIDQHLKLFLDFFVGMTTHNLIERFDEFKKDINSILSPEKIKQLEKAIQSQKFSHNEDFNKKVLQENSELLKLMQHFLKIIEHVSEKSKTLDNVDLYHYIVKIIQFITINSQGFTQIKNVFWIDINEVFRKYVYAETPRWIKKLLLWLLDAKINILAFMQNITQIFYNKNFFDPNFEWNLVVRKDQLSHMQKIAPEVIERFKKLQEKILKDHDTNREIANEINENIGYFCDILIWDKIESHIYATALIHYWLTEINVDYTDEAIEMFQPTFELFKELLEWIEEFSQALDAPKLQKYQNDLERNKRREEKGKPPKEVEIFTPGKNKNYLDIKQAILKKLIRFHREENNPLVIIKTVQNAYNHIIQNGYQPSDSLHILSVNYGGSIIGYYARHMFEKMQWNGRVLANIWNIVYSIYDLKNANDFLSIVDYPFNEYIEEFDSEEMKDFFRQRNHLLIFDDNTSSGRTLNDLKTLAQKMEIYGKVDIFACRASEREELYDDKVSDDTILWLIINSATTVRKTKVWPLKRGYKELSGMYIGNTLYKTHFSLLKK